MDIRAHLIDQLVREEGLQLKPYHDTVGKLTIGIGRNLDDVGISHDEALLLLNNDIDRASAALRSRFPWVINLDDTRQAVLIDMAFNMGVVTLAKFTDTLAHIQSGDYVAASQAMLDSTWAKEVGMRAIRLAEQMRTGEWQ